MLNKFGMAIAAFPRPLLAALIVLATTATIIGVAQLISAQEGPETEETEDSQDSRGHCWDHWLCLDATATPVPTPRPTAVPFCTQYPLHPACHRPTPVPASDRYARSSASTDGYAGATATPDKHTGAAAYRYGSTAANGHASTASGKHAGPSYSNTPASHPAHGHPDAYADDPEPRPNADASRGRHMPRILPVGRPACGAVPRDNHRRFRPYHAPGAVRRTENRCARRRPDQRGVRGHPAGPAAACTSTAVAPTSPSLGAWRAALGTGYSTRSGPATGTREGT